MDYLLLIAARWVHIMSAVLALGVPIYMRFVLLPALQAVDETARASVQEGLVRRWRIWVHVLIVALLATGFYNYLVVARWRDDAYPPDLRGRYHMLLGIKIMIALAMFFIASALAGRSQALASIRANARTWLNILIVLGLALVALSNVVRFLPRVG
jgi:uncharacterized membrane protein